LIIDKKKGRNCRDIIIFKSHNHLISFTTYSNFIYCKSF